MARSSRKKLAGTSARPGESGKLVESRRGLRDFVLEIAQRGLDNETRVVLMNCLGGRKVNSNYLINQCSFRREEADIAFRELAAEHRKGQGWLFNSGFQMDKERKTIWHQPSVDEIYPKIGAEEDLDDR